jgi:hypothetical protein
MSTQPVSSASTAENTTAFFAAKPDHRLAMEVYKKKVAVEKISLTLVALLTCIGAVGAYRDHLLHSSKDYRKNKDIVNALFADSVYPINITFPYQILVVSIVVTAMFICRLAALKSPSLEFFSEDTTLAPVICIKTNHTTSPPKLGIRVDALLAFAYDHNCWEWNTDEVVRKIITNAVTPKSITCKMLWENPPSLRPTVGRQNLVIW